MTWNEFVNVIPLLDNRNRVSLVWYAVYITIAIPLFFYFRQKPKSNLIDTDPNTSAFKKFIHFVFPVKIYTHPSAKFDYWIFFWEKWIFALAMAFFFGLNSVFDETTALTGTIGRYISKSLGYLITDNMFSGKSIAINILWTIVSAICYDLARALIHYSFHKVPFLWEFHKIHHDAEVLTPFTLYRQHPLETQLTYLGLGAASGIGLGAFLLIFGKNNFSLITIMGTSVAIAIQNVFALYRHSSMWLNFGKWAYFITNPCGHIVHHSAELRHRDKNFANILPIWDMMLGTLYIPSQVEHFKIGTRGPDGKAWYNRSQLYFYFGVFAVSAKKLFSSGSNSEDEFDNSKLHLVKDDGLNCWCSTDCKLIRYPGDNPNPPPAWTKLSDFWELKIPNETADEAK